MSQLSSFVESLLQYHRQATQIMEELSDKLSERSAPDYFWKVACLLYVEASSSGS